LFHISVLKEPDIGKVNTDGIIFYTGDLLKAQGQIILMDRSYGAFAWCIACYSPD
jgi:hypothetical protein